jgi:DNA helicase-2/ATP-dependent DNA helicase PcrA
MLAAPEHHLFIVGDDDQSIYRFRGARPEIMLNFTRDYPNAAVIELDHNFRSTPQILQPALAVIGKNKRRYEKHLRAVRPDGSPIELREFADPGQECRYLVECIRSSIAGGRSGSEIAVLFRTNQAARPFAERLMEFNLPFEMRDAMPNLYEHWISRDILAYLHLANEGLTRREFLQVMNRPKRYLSRDSAASPVITMDELRRYYAGKDWMMDRIDRLEMDLQIVRSLKPYAAVNYIRKGIGYEEFLQEYAKQRRIREEELVELLDELQESARPFATFDAWLDHIAEYKKTLEEQSRKKEKNEDAITLATFHSSKGLEFEEVFLVDANQGVIPHQKVMLEADLEEERRLFYVGMTRAKDLLHIYYVRERYGHAMEPSEFLEPFLEEPDKNRTKQ